MNDRRIFLKKLGRGAMALGLAGVSGYLLFREHPSDACSFDFVCGNCRKRTSCELPEAQDFRKAQPEHQKSR
jgi:hypothetical protein